MTRPIEEVVAVLEMGSHGLSACAISRDTGIPRETVRDWLSGKAPGSQLSKTSASSCSACGASSHLFDELPETYAYLLGLYLGDGCISAHRRGVYKLRVTLDQRYPGIIAECGAAIGDVFPRIKVGYLQRKGAVDVYGYSKSLPCLFPQHGPGRKHKRAIVLADWQESLLEQWPEVLLRGLIHSDGCRFMNTGRNWRHPRYVFNNHSDDIRGIFCRACEAIGVRWTTAPRTVYVSRVLDVAKLDEFIGPKS